MKSYETQKAHIGIRTAQPDDAARICEIRDKAWLEAYPNPKLGITRENILRNAQGLNGEFIPRRIAHISRQCELNTDPTLATLVAEYENEVVGYAMPSKDERGRYFISGLYVLPAKQGLGIGSQLLEQCISNISRENDIFLEVVSYNEQAIRLYKKFGFIKTDIEPEDEETPDFIVKLPQVVMLLPKLG